MNYVSRVSFVMCSLFLSLIFFQIHSETHEGDFYKEHNQALCVIENLECDDDISAQPVFRLVIEGSMTILDSQTKEIGNFMKKDSSGNVRRFIHNYGKDSVVQSKENTFVGIRSGNFSMTDRAANNTTIGVDSLRRNVSGKRNTAIGKAAATENLAGDSNVAAGYNALRDNTKGSFNVAVGDSALVNLNSTNAASFNVAIGRSALQGLTEGSDNVVVGALAGFFSSATESTGSRNVFIGYQAGNSDNPGSDNIYVGDSAGRSASGGTNNICIGHVGAQESNVIRIGTLGNQKNCFIAAIAGSSPGLFDYIPVVIDSNGQLGTISSSRRFKNNINQIEDESKVLYCLEPVSFMYKNDEKATKNFGLIAEDVNKHCPGLVVKDSNDMPYTVRYELLPVLLLNELKKHRIAIEKQMFDINKQKHTIEIKERHMQAQEGELARRNCTIKQQKEMLENILYIIADLQDKVHCFMANNN